MATFGHLLKKLREGQDMTQEQLALAAGVSVMTVSKLERDRHAPTGRTVRRMAVALKMPPEELRRLMVETADEVSVKIPRDAYAHAAEQAANDGLTPEAWIVKTIRPADQSARRPLTDMRTPPPTRGRGKTPRKRH